jgi:hypothetical protein
VFRSKEDILPSDGCVNICVSGCEFETNNTDGGSVSRSGGVGERLESISVKEENGEVSKLKCSLKWGRGTGRGVAGAEKA